METRAILSLLLSIFPLFRVDYPARRLCLFSCFAYAMLVVSGCTLPAGDSNLEPPSRSPDPPALVHPSDGATIGFHRGCPIPVQFTWRHGGALIAGNTGIPATHFLVCVYRPGQICSWDTFMQRLQANNNGERVGLSGGIPDHIWSVAVGDPKLVRERLGSSELTLRGVDPAYLYRFDAPAPTNTVPVSGGLPGLDPLLDQVPDLKWTVAACSSSQNCQLASPYNLGVSVLPQPNEDPTRPQVSVCEP